MRSKMVKLAVTILGVNVLFLVAVLGFEFWSSTQMQRLGVVIYVTPEVIERGAVVSIMTRKFPVDEFEARYPLPETPPDLPGAPRAARQWSGTVSGPVTMVYFDIPDDRSYTYRFRSVPRDGVAEANVPERVLTIGGNGYDAEGRDTSYFRFGLTRAHEIVQLFGARAWIPYIGDYADEDLICEEGSGLRVCAPTEDALKARAQYMTNGEPEIRGMRPWAE